MSTFELPAQMRAIECCNCGMTFGMPTTFYRERRRDHDWFYCPAGHRQYFSGKSDIEELEDQLELKRKELKWAHARANQAEACCEGVERSRRAHKAHFTRLKNKVAEMLGEEVEG